MRLIGKHGVFLFICLELFFHSCPKRNLFPTMKVILLSFALSLLLLSCEKPFCHEKPNDEIAGIVIRLIGDGRYLAYQEGIGDLNRYGMHITTDVDYRHVFEHCCAGRLDTIDFTKYDILGLGTLNKGQKSTYLREVYMDDARKKVFYTVTERYCRRSSPVQGHGNFVLVPKLPQGYSIEYIRK
jgi:hypothetical protein